MADFNKTVASQQATIRHYINYRGLQKPEQVIFSQLADRLARMNMLDLGVGAGRTTPFLLTHSAHYTGVDYSEGMIRYCRKKFAGSRAVFEVGDARHLEQFSRNEFDFVLFSFNGIDFVNAEDRLAILEEVRRILKPGGLFCFSSHNIQGLQRYLSIRFRLNLWELYKRFRMQSRLMAMNREQLKLIPTADYVSFYDGAHQFQLLNLYIRPSYQIRQLKASGFDHIRIFNLSEGRELRPGTELDSNRDFWLYYLCEKGNPGTA